MENKIHIESDERCMSRELSRLNRTPTEKNNDDVVNTFYTLKHTDCPLLTNSNIHMLAQIVNYSVRHGVLNTGNKKENEC